MPSFSETIRTLERESASIAALMGVVTPSTAFNALHATGMPVVSTDTDANGTTTSLRYAHSEDMSSNSWAVTPRGAVTAGAALPALNGFVGDGSNGTSVLNADPLLPGIAGLSDSLQSDYSEFQNTGDELVTAASTPAQPDAGVAPEFAQDGLAALLARLVEQADQTQTELSSDFTGERQGLVRGYVEDLGQHLGQSSRDFFQDSVRGEVKGVLMDGVEHTGNAALGQATDPLFDVDYYGAGATLINTGLHAVPIGAVALPQVGPLVTQSQSELANYLGR